MAAKRRGPHFLTYTGRTFWPMDPRPDEVSILDIAQALSHQCRFSGHTREFYSVAEHSVRVSQIVPAPHQLWALLHDAAEAYLLDWPRPLKQNGLMGWLYRRAERRLMRVICQRFVPLPERIVPLTPAEAKTAFLERFQKLTAGR
jgi:5'-deoxynucleotidase YfbR-like HD superfamily hydrolase